MPSRCCLLYIYKHAAKIIRGTRVFINDTKISEIRVAGTAIIINVVTG